MHNSPLDLPPEQLAEQLAKLAFVNRELHPDDQRQPQWESWLQQAAAELPTLRTKAAGPGFWNTMGSLASRAAKSLSNLEPVSPGAGASAGPNLPDLIGSGFDTAVGWAKEHPETAGLGLGLVGGGLLGGLAEQSRDPKDRNTGQSMLTGALAGGLAGGGLGYMLPRSQQISEYFNPAPTKPPAPPAGGANASAGPAANTLDYSPPPTKDWQGLDPSHHPKLKQWLMSVDPAKYSPEQLGEMQTAWEQIAASQKPTAASSAAMTLPFTGTFSGVQALRGLNRIRNNNGPVMSRVREQLITRGSGTTPFNPTAKTPPTPLDQLSQRFVAGHLPPEQLRAVAKQVEKNKGLPVNASPHMTRPETVALGGLTNAMRPAARNAVARGVLRHGIYNLLPFLSTHAAREYLNQQQY